MEIPRVGEILYASDFGCGGIFLRALSVCRCYKKTEFRLSTVDVALLAPGHVMPGDHPTICW
jgi:hypothetical protein